MPALVWMYQSEPPPEDPCLDLQEADVGDELEDDDLGPVTLLGKGEPDMLRVDVEGAAMERPIGRLKVPDGGPRKKVPSCADQVSGEHNTVLPPQYVIEHNDTDAQARTCVDGAEEAEVEAAEVQTTKLEPEVGGTGECAAEGEHNGALEPDPPPPKPKEQLELDSESERSLSGRSSSVVHCDLTAEEEEEPEMEDLMETFEAVTQQMTDEADTHGLDKEGMDVLFFKLLVRASPCECFALVHD